MYSDRLQPDPIGCTEHEGWVEWRPAPRPRLCNLQVSWLHLAEGNALGRGGISSQCFMHLGSEIFGLKGNFQDTNKIHYSRQLSSFVS